MGRVVVVVAGTLFGMFSALHEDRSRIVGVADLSATMIPMDFSIPADIDHL